jgi:hypothetical protein
MPNEHRELLIGFERGEPDWLILGVDHAADLPAIRWRQQNLDKLDEYVRKRLVENLRRVLSV